MDLLASHVDLAAMITPAGNPLIYFFGLMDFEVF
jgi:hypothetical protein